MKEDTKIEIQKRVAHLASRITQNAVANRAEVSGGTISQIIAGNWKNIADSMWKTVMVNLRLDLNWNLAETQSLNKVWQLCYSAQHRSLVICISDEAGRGKSFGYKFYDRVSQNVIHVECKRSWTTKTYVKNLLIASGLRPEGTKEEMLDALNSRIKKMHRPLLIIDQADKLKDPQLDLFMEFYNDHEGHLGIVLSGVKALEKRIESGCQRKKIGYDEIRSRFGNRYIRLEPLSQADVKNICRANGVDDPEVWQRAYDTCAGDVRRVRREVEKYKLGRMEIPAAPVQEVA